MFAIQRIKSINRVCGYWMSNQRYKLDILRSKFHAEGWSHFQKSRLMTRNLPTNVVEIDQLQLKLQKLRIKISEDTRKATSQKGQLLGSEDLKEYFGTYLKLVQLIELSAMDEEWYYRIIGWYNLQSFLRTMVEKMLVSSSKGGHMGLVEIIGWMNPHIYSSLASSDFQQYKRQQKLCQNYYKKLNITHQISFVRQVEAILKNILNENKGKYISNYTQRNLDRMMKQVKSGSTQNINDIFWLMNNYIATYNDKSSIIQTFVSFIKQKKIKLSKEQIETLMSIYNKIGNIDNQLYQIYIRPYLLGRIQRPEQELVSILQFLTYSQIQDLDTVQLFLKQFCKRVKKGEVDDHQKHKVHHLLHYHKIRDHQWEISSLIGKKLDQCCRRYQGNGTTARMMTIQLDQKSRQEGQPYYISDCLRKNRLNVPIKQDVGHEVNPKIPFRRYPNIRFCTIQIQNCVVNTQTKQAVILHKNYTKFQHSKKLQRSIEVRDTILKHYGFKINYLQNKVFLKTLPKTNQHS